MRFAILASALAMLCSGCASADTVTGSGGDTYGRSMALQGVAVNGFEVDAVTLCKGRKADCIASANGSTNKACWNEWTREANTQLMALTDGQAYAKYDYRSYWMEFTGRVTTREGSFGHLGAYPCKVLVETVTVYELLPSAN